MVVSDWQLWLWQATGSGCCQTGSSCDSPSCDCGKAIRHVNYKPIAICHRRWLCQTGSSCTCDSPSWDCGEALLTIVYMPQEVVVVSQAAPVRVPAVTVARQPCVRAQDYLILSVVMTVLCTIHACWPTLLCLIPAIIFGVIVSYSGCIVEGHTVWLCN